MLDGLLDDLLADSPPQKGEFRPFRPGFRPDEIQQPRGFSPNSPNSPLAGVISDSPLPANDPPPTILDRLAQAIAEECGVSAEVCLSALDDGDKADIADGDAGMLTAWKTAVRSLTTKAKPIQAPAGYVVVNTPAGHPVLVRAESNEHAELLRRLNPAPEAAGKASAVLASVRCCDCRHAQPAAPGMIDCAKEVPAPGAVGPFRWWATDSHRCDTREARA